jgi:hypothetical protein
MLEKDELKRGDCRKGGPAGTFRLGADSAGKVGCQQGGPGGLKDVTFRYVTFRWRSETFIPRF